MDRGGMAMKRVGDSLRRRITGMLRPGSTDDLRSRQQQLLPHGAIVNVLSRLPPKSIVRCGCVCKSWHALLSDPDFIERHLQKKMNSTVGRPVDLDSTRVVCCHLYSDFLSCSLQSFLHQPSSSTVKLVRPFTGAKAHVIGSCNGLVCVMMWVNGRGASFVVWNPCTGVYRQLPDGCGLRLDEDLVYGFGYDHSTDDYKVVAVCRYNLHRSPATLAERVAVFSLRADSWRMVPCVESWFFSSDPGCLVGGALNWGVKSRLPADKFTKFSIGVASFDLASEKFRTMGLNKDILHNGVDGIGHHEGSTTIGVMDGCLCLLKYDKGASAHQLWVMNELGVESSWTLVGSIPHLPNGDPTYQLRRPTLLCRFKDSVILNTGELPNRLGVFDLKEGTHKFPMTHFGCDCHAGVIYRESLVSPYPHHQNNTPKRKSILGTKPLACFRA